MRRIGPSEKGNEEQAKAVEPIEPDGRFLLQTGVVAAFTHGRCWVSGRPGDVIFRLRRRQRRFEEGTTWRACRSLVSGLRYMAMGTAQRWAAVFAAIIASLAWAAGIGVLDYVGTFEPAQKASGCDELKFENWKLMRDVIGAGIAGALFIGGCIWAAALTSLSATGPGSSRWRSFGRGGSAGVYWW